MNKFISFFEIPAADFNRAIDFYQTVFNTTLPAMDCDTEKMAFFNEDDVAVGAISWAKDFTPSPHGVLIHFNCKDLDKTLSLIESKGGKVLIPKTKIEAEGRGYFATFTDSEGNSIGLYAD